jgi:hypothetical protein
LIRALGKKERLFAEPVMNPQSLSSIATTYSGFQALPRGIKQMLLVTESLFFEDARPRPADLSRHDVPHEILHLHHAGSQYESFPRPPTRAQ